VSKTSNCPCCGNDIDQRPVRVGRRQKRINVTPFDVANARAYTIQAMERCSLTLTDRDGLRSHPCRADLDDFDAVRILLAAIARAQLSPFKTGVRVNEQSAVGHRVQSSRCKQVARSPNHER
jgi:hypothetical protein